MGGVLILILVVFGLLCVVVLIRQFQPPAPAKVQYWDGPKPTLEQRQDNWQFIVEFLKESPNSDLAKEYPELAKVAAASKRYDEIQELHELGQISEEQYQKEVEQLLPLIDISKDLK